MIDIMNKRDRIIMSTITQTNRIDLNLNAAHERPNERSRWAELDRF